MDSTPPTSTDAARALVALRRRVTKRCAVCGCEMVGIKIKTTCSVACRSKLYRQRKEQREQGENPR